MSEKEIERVIDEELETVIREIAEKVNLTECRYKQAIPYFKETRSAESVDRRPIDPKVCYAKGYAMVTLNLDLSDQRARVPKAIEALKKEMEQLEKWERGI